MVTLTKQTTNLNKDNIGYTELWDFSQANLSEENRINAITTIASICYANPKAINRKSLYDRLAQESLGLPSSSFEFVPVLLNKDRLQEMKVAYIDYYKANKKEDDVYFTMSIFRFGEEFNKKDSYYLITNLRALMSDYRILKPYIKDEGKWLEWFNTEEECSLIKKHIKVFKSKIDLNTARQLVRHRGSFQELSRRYVNSKKEPLEFFNKLGKEEAELIEKSVELYSKKMKEGYKAEEVRRILPQSLYTTIWYWFLPKGLENFFQLRTSKHAQSEINTLAKANLQMIGN